MEDFILWAAVGLFFGVLVGIPATILILAGRGERPPSPDFGPPPSMFPPEPAEPQRWTVVVPVKRLPARLGVDDDDGAQRTRRAKASGA